MDARAKMTSKGRVTIPKRVRDALELREGDELDFHVERSRAFIAKAPDLLSFADAVAVPRETRGTPWDEVVRRTRHERARRRR
jgi:AbrB family looped-hinge helix DNA binding protein